MKQLAGVIISFILCANLLFVKHSNATPVSGAADPIDKFWEWFKANQSRLRNFEKDPDKYLSELSAAIRKVQPGLAIELEPPEKDIIHLTISANGNRDLFDKVQELVRRAPTLTGWVFYAFRQRVPADRIKDLKLKIGMIELDPLMMKFFPVVENDSLNIIIYTSGVTKENFNEIAYAGLLLLDNILGEYDCVTKVKNYDFQNMPASKEEQKDLLPLKDIATYVDKFHRSPR